jgi:hypothetical protein
MRKRFVIALLLAATLLTPGYANFVHLRSTSLVHKNPGDGHNA